MLGRLVPFLFTTLHPIFQNGNVLYPFLPRLEVGRLKKPDGQEDVENANSAFGMETLFRSIDYTFVKFLLGLAGHLSNERLRASLVAGDLAH